MNLRANPLGGLSARQRQVLELLAKGLTNSEIASVLGVSAETIKSHVSALLEALDVTNRTEAAALANRMDPALETGFDERPAIAVLPLDLEGIDAEHRDVFAAGLVDDLVGQLSRWRWFPVVARASSLAVGAVAGRRAPALGRELGARYLLHGRIHVRAGRARLHVVLDDATQDRCIWSERFEVGREDLFDVQDALAQEVVGAAFPNLVAAEVWRARRSRARTLTSWLQVHRAIGLVERRAPGDNAQAHALLDTLDDGDRLFVPAMYARGLAFFQDVLNAWCPDLEDHRRQIHELAETTVRVWPEAPHGHMLRARAAMTRGEWNTAIEHANVATAITPSLAEGHALAGQILTMTGRCDEGLTRMRRAQRLSPKAYVAAITIALFAAGRHDEAREICEQVLADRPLYLFPRIVAVAACARSGDHAGARAHGERLREAYPALRTRDLTRIWAGHAFDVGEEVIESLRAIGVPG